MIAVIFEVVPYPQHKQEYLDIAARLRPELEKIKGFISVERFQSLSDPNKLLSVSFYENETAIDEWRNMHAHRSAQRKGRDSIFSNYRIRVMSIIRDYSLNDRGQAPIDSQDIHI